MEITTGTQLLNRAPQFEIQSAVDLTDLSAANMASLRFCLAQFKMTQHRIANDVFSLTQQLVQMQEIVGHRFTDFAAEQLGLSSRTIRRYMNINKVLVAHFSHDGQINVVEAKMFTQSALSLLSPDTDEDVMEEIRLLAKKGEIVGEATVRKLLEQREGALEAKITASQAEAEIANKELKELTDRSELVAARLEGQLKKHEEQVRRLTEQRTALEDEIQVLRSQETQVIEKEVEIIPAGFKSIQDAIEATQKSLEQTIAKKDRIDEEVALAESKCASLKVNLATIEAGEEEYSKLKSQIDTIILKYPAALLLAVSNSSPDAKNALAGAADSLILLGNQLRNAAIGS